MFQFPTDINLEHPPLAEAWLDIRWQLEPSAGGPQFLRDPNFPFALGTFYESVKDRFSYREDLEASQAPQDMLPHVVRHRFRASKNEWPLLQLGPGVASVNFTEPYTWKDFEEAALYLQSKLSDAYSESELVTKTITLRYRNTEPFNYSSRNLLAFLQENLNTSLTLPAYIPGPTGFTDLPTSANIVLTFNLSEPKGTGTLRLAAGTRKQGVLPSDLGEVEVVIWQLEVTSEGSNAPKIASEDQFISWLNSAHAILHEWFFSLIDGPLLARYKGKENADA
jgi:uncharacterized protein (TIGR04255 family)